MAEGDLQEQYTRLKRSALELELEEIKAVKEAEQVALRGGSDAPTREGRAASYYAQRTFMTNIMKSLRLGMKSRPSKEPDTSR